FTFSALPFFLDRCALCTYCLLFTSLFLFLILPPPPKSTLFPYTTLFRSSITGRSHITMPPEWIPRWRGSFSNWRAISSTSAGIRSEEHTSELQSRFDLVCRLLLEKKKKNYIS